MLVNDDILQTVFRDEEKYSTDTEFYQYVLYRFGYLKTSFIEGAYSKNQILNLSCFQDYLIYTPPAMLSDLEDSEIETEQQVTTSQNQPSLFELITTKHKRRRYTQSNSVIKTFWGLLAGLCHLR